MVRTPQAPAPPKRRRGPAAGWVYQRGVVQENAAYDVAGVFPSTVTRTSPAGIAA